VLAFLVKYPDKEFTVADLNRPSAGA